MRTLFFVAIELENTTNGQDGGQWQSLVKRMDGTTLARSASWSTTEAQGARINHTFRDKQATRLHRFASQLVLLPKNTKSLLFYIFSLSYYLSSSNTIHLSLVIQSFTTSFGIFSRRSRPLNINKPLSFLLPPFSSEIMASTIGQILAKKG